MRSSQTRYPTVTGRRADPSNPADFCSFEEVLAAYDGIGIGCFGEIGMTDVDGCVHDGVLYESWQDIVNIMDSYTETSLSGTGVHIFYLVTYFQYDRNRYYINSRKNHVESYVLGVTYRFLILTGKCIYGSELEERTERLKLVLEKYMVCPRTDVEKPTVTAPSSFLSDESVLRKMFASRQGEKAL